MRRWICIVIVILQCISMSAQEAIAVFNFVDFVEWLAAKHNLSVSYAHDVALEEPLSLDTASIELLEIFELLEGRSDIDYFLDDADRLFLKQGVPIAEGVKVSNFRILDQNNDPLPHVAISIPGSSLGGYTDDSGELQLEIGERYSQDTMVIQLIGYENCVMAIASIELEHTIQLKTSSAIVESVLIEDRKDQVSFSKDGSYTSIQAQDIGDASDLFGKDVMRQLQSMAGIAAYQDDDTGIRIRGSDAYQTLLLMDGIPLFEANHYYGIFGSINGAHVDQTLLYRNNLPIQYGEKNGGMVSFKSNENDPKSGVNGKLDINLLTSSLAIEGAIDSSWSYNFAGRTSYQNVSNTGLFSLFDDEDDFNDVQNFTIGPATTSINTVPEFKFYDVNGNVTFRPNSNSHIEVNFYKSKDVLKNAGTVEWPALLFDRTNQFKFIQDEQWESLGFSLISKFKVGKKSTLLIDGYWSRFSRININTAIVRLGVLNMQKVGTENEITERGIRAALETHVSDGVQIKIGTDISNHDLLLRSGDASTRRLDLKDAAWMYSVYSDVDMRLGQGWQINAGVRATHYNITEQLYTSPRLNFVKEILPSFSVKGSLGRQYQVTQNLTFENLYRRNVNIWVLSNNREIPVSTLDHFMLGMNGRKGRWQIDVEAYYRYTKELTELALSDLNINDNGGARQNDADYNLYNGNGRTIGIDITTNYTGKKWSSILTYTLSKSIQSFDNIAMGTWFPSQQDRRHQLYWNNDYRIGDWNVGWGAVYASGMPYTDLNNLENNGFREVLDPNQRLSFLPDYIRFDLGIGYRFQLGNTQSKVSANLLNVFDRENVSYIQYMFDAPAPAQNSVRGVAVGTSSLLLPRTLNLSWQLSF